MTAPRRAPIAYAPHPLDASVAAGVSVSVLGLGADHHFNVSVHVGVQVQR